MSDMEYAQRLVAARNAQALVAPGGEPQSRAGAYDIQRLTADILGETVAGWKVANHPELGPIAAPIFAGVSKANGAQWPITKGLGIEIEVALHLGRDLPRGTYQREDILAAVDQITLGVELVGARLPGENRNLNAFLADLMANVGYVMGAEPTGWQDAPFVGRRCRLVLDGETVHDAHAAPPPLDPLAVTAAWLARGDDALGGLKAGQFVTTGSITPVLPAKRPGRAMASLEGLGSVEILFA